MQSSIKELDYAITNSKRNMKANINAITLATIVKATIHASAVHAFRGTVNICGQEIVTTII